MPASFDQWLYAACRLGRSGTSGYQTYSASPGVTPEEERELAKLAHFIAGGDEAAPLSAFGIKRLASGRWSFCRSSQGATDDLGRPGYYSHAILVDKVNDLPWPPYFYFQSPSFRGPLTDQEQKVATVPPPLPQIELEIGNLFEDFRDNAGGWLGEFVEQWPQATRQLLASAFWEQPYHQVLVAEEAEAVLAVFALAWHECDREGRRDLSVCTLQPDRNDTAFTVAGWPPRLGRPDDRFLHRFSTVFAWNMPIPATPPPLPTSLPLAPPPLPGVPSPLAPVVTPRNAPLAPPHDPLRWLFQAQAEDLTQRKMAPVVQLARRDFRAWLVREAELLASGGLPPAGLLTLGMVREELGNFAELPPELPRTLARAFRRDPSLQQPIVRLLDRFPLASQEEAVTSLPEEARLVLAGVWVAMLDARRLAEWVARSPFWAAAMFSQLTHLRADREKLVQAMAEIPRCADVRETTIFVGELLARVPPGELEPETVLPLISYVSGQVRHLLLTRLDDTAEKLLDLALPEVPKSDSIPAEYARLRAILLMRELHGLAEAGSEEWFTVVGKRARDFKFAHRDPKLAARLTALVLELGSRMFPGREQYWVQQFLGQPAIPPPSVAEHGQASIATIAPTKSSSGKGGFLAALRANPKIGSARKSALRALPYLAVAIALFMGVFYWQKHAAQQKAQAQAEQEKLVRQFSEEPGLRGRKDLLAQAEKLQTPQYPAMRRQLADDILAALRPLQHDLAQLPSIGTAGVVKSRSQELDDLKVLTEDEVEPLESLLSRATELDKAIFLKDWPLVKRLAGEANPKWLMERLSTVNSTTTPAATPAVKRAPSREQIADLERIIQAAVPVGDDQVDRIQAAESALAKFRQEYDQGFKDAALYLQTARDRRDQEWKTNRKRLETLQQGLRSLLESQPPKWTLDARRKAADLESFRSHFKNPEARDFADWPGKVETAIAQWRQQLLEGCLKSFAKKETHTAGVEARSRFTAEFPDEKQAASDLVWCETPLKQFANGRYVETAVALRERLKAKEQSDVLQSVSNLLAELGLPSGLTETKDGFFKIEELGSDLQVTPALLKVIQKTLAKEGLLKGSEDGRMGAGTQNAIIAGQFARGLKTTGRIDSAFLSTFGINPP